MRSVPRYPPAQYLLGALIEDGAPHQWAFDTATSYRQVFGGNDDIKIDKLCWALWGLFMGRGYTNAALAIITLPSDRATYVETARVTFDDLEGVA